MNSRAIAIKVLPVFAKRRMLFYQRRLVDRRVELRMRTGRLGPLPSFLIIGFGKCGTTELYDRLIEHPNIRPSLRKEVNFFMNRYDEGVAWYRAHFPVEHRGHNSDRFVVGEASPGYVINPFAPTRIRDVVPEIKLIVLLRDPVARAYSHFHHLRRIGGEPLPTFEEALSAEPERLWGERERVYADPNYSRFAWYVHSYVTQGIYADFLPPWMEEFSTDQLLVVRSEDFFRDQVSTLRAITRFLELPDWAPRASRQHKAFSYQAMKSETRDQLRQVFAPHNERLFSLLGEDFGWNDERTTQLQVASPLGAALIS